MPVISAIRATDASVSLNGRRVLDGVDLDLPEGETVVLLGGNGSGKTTLVRALLGLVPLERGSVELFGAPVQSFRDWHKIGYVPQRLTLPSSLPATVHEVVLSGRIAHVGLWRRFTDGDRAAVRNALERADLASVEKARVSDLSGGLQQRVLIARALASEPEILVLDEPVSSVDVAHQVQFARLLGDAARSGTTVLLVAHALGAMEGLASRAIVLDEGRKVYDGPPDAAVHRHDVHHHEPEHDVGLRPIGDER